MSIRSNFKKHIESRAMLQVRINKDLLHFMDAQISHDLEAGLAVNRTVVVTEGIKAYLRESAAAARKKAV